MSPICALGPGSIMFGAHPEHGTVVLLCSAPITSARKEKAAEGFKLFLIVRPDTKE